MRKHSKRSSSNLWLLLTVLAIALSEAMASFSRQSFITANLEDTENKDTEACEGYFHITPSQIDPSTATILLFAEHHDTDKDDERIADCIASFSAPGDRLLIEVTDIGKTVDCSALHPAYRRFNSELECYGFDLPVTEARRLYSDFAYRANFIATKILAFFEGKSSAKQIRRRIKSFGDHISKIKLSDKFIDLEFNKRFGEYLKELITRMKGLSIKQMQAFLTEENNSLADMAAIYESLSRKGPTNKSLVQAIRKHRLQLLNSANKHRLFVVAGTAHMDPQRNIDLSTLVDREPVAIFHLK